MDPEKDIGANLFLQTIRKGKFASWACQDLLRLAGVNEN
jgi:hypothetical protein